MFTLISDSAEVVKCCLSQGIIIAKVDCLCFACVHAHHPAVKVSDLPHNFPKSQGKKLVGGSYLLCNLVRIMSPLSTNPPSFCMFPVKIFDSLGIERDRQLTVESGAWANSANTQRGGPRPHGGCLSVTGGINTPPTLKALQKRHGYSNSYDMQPVPSDSGMNEVYLWFRWKKG